MSKKPKQILIFSLAYYPDFWGGAEVAIKEITDRIPKEEVSFDMVTAKLNFKQKRKERVGNVNVYRVGLGFETLDKFLIPILGFLKAHNLNKKRKYYVAWQMMANQASVAASFFKFFNKDVPLVLTLQEGDEEEHLKRYVFGNEFLYKLLIRPWHLMVFKFANKTTVISRYLRDRVISSGFDGLIEFVPNGANLESFSKKYSKEILENLKKETGFRKEDKIIIHTGRFVGKNAMDDLIRSLKYLPKQYKLLLVGTGPDLYKLQNLAEKERVSERVKFLGYIHTSEVPKYVKISDVFVRPSLSEGQGVSFIETMAAGVPMVATPVGGIPDFLKDRETGLFCEVKNPKSIASKVRLLERNSELRQSIVANARKLAKEKYSWGLISAEMLNKAFSGFAKKKKKVVIASSIYLPDLGGPSYYAKRLNEEFKAMGHGVRVVRYSWERKLPGGIKHFVYLLKLLWATPGSDFILALDTFLVAVPAAIVSKIFKKKLLLRTGGDFLWEQYIERNGPVVLLPDFYGSNPKFTPKEKFIFRLTKFALQRVDVLLFSTDYQRKIFIEPYELNPKKCFVLENSYKEKAPSNEPTEKNFFWGGRDIQFKNIKRMKKALKEAQKENKEVVPDVVLKISHDELMEKIKNCYVFIAPALSEISPNIVLRAISFNKPFIVTEDTGLKKRLKDIAVFVDPMDVQSIKEGILFLADDSNYKKMKKKVENFKFTHSYREIAEEILEIADTNIQI